MKARLTLLCALALTALLFSSPAVIAAVVVAQLSAAQSNTVNSSPGGVRHLAKDKDKDKDKNKGDDDDNDDDDDDKTCKKPKKHKPSRC